MHRAEPKPTQDDPAFQLLIACLNVSEGQPEQVQAIQEARASLGEDWTSFIALLERHHCLIPAVRALRDAAVEVPEALSTLANQQQRRALALCSRSLQLTEHLKAQGRRPVLLKGPLLSQWLFGDPAQRHSTDIDILVPWSDFEASIADLERFGLERHGARPPFGSWRINLWRRLAKDVTLLDPESGFAVELHHRPKSPDTLLPGIDHSNANVEMRLAATEQSVFSHGDMFVYLCVHASTSLWHRLKWLFDIKVLIDGLRDAEIDALLAHAKAHGCQRCAALGLLLVHEIWGRPLPQSVILLRESDDALKELVAASMKRIREPERRYSSLANTLARRHLMQLREDSEYRRSLRLEYIYDRELLERYTLPKSLRWLYLPLRTSLFIQRKIGIR